MDLGYLAMPVETSDRRRVKNLIRYTTLSTYTFYFFFLPKATEAWIGTILSTQVTKGGVIMAESFIFVAITVLCVGATLLAGYALGRMHKPKVHISGKLLIDTTGDKDRWTIFFDDDLGDVEKMDKVVLRIERVE